MNSNKIGLSQAKSNEQNRQFPTLLVLNPIQNKWISVSSFDDHHKTLSQFLLYFCAPLVITPQY